jgi:hypothetical protein
MVVMAMHGRMVAVLEDAAQRRGWHVPRRRAKLIISSGVEGKLEVARWWGNGSVWRDPREGGGCELVFVYE